MDSYITVLSVADVAEGPRTDPEDPVIIWQRNLRDELKTAIDPPAFRRMQPLQKPPVLARLTEEM